MYEVNNTQNKDASFRHYSVGTAKESVWDGVVRILIVAGYGGHAGYALALAHELKNAGANLDIVVPITYKWVAARFSKLGRILYLTLPRRPGEPLYRTVTRWPKSFLEATHLIRGNYDAVIATGSNFSIPPALLQKLLKKPTYTLEAIDRITSPSRAVKILYKLKATTFLHWEEQKKSYPNGVLVGPIFEPKFYEVKDEGYILVTTGTWGLPQLYTALSKIGVDNTVIQSGDIDPKKVRRLNSKWTVFRYTRDIHKWIARATIVITHFPGSTAATARLAYGKPVVMVYSTRHKHLAPPTDGRILAKKLNAVFLEDITPENLAQALDKAKQMPAPNYPNGSKRAVAYILRRVTNIKTK